MRLVDNCAAGNTLEVFSVHSESYSHVGEVRKNNEDSIFCDTGLGLFIVADGIGGRQDGEIASAIAVKVTAQRVEQNDIEESTPLEVLREAFYEVNHILYKAGKKQDGGGMGTTMTAALVSNEKIYLAHVGDSRAYHIDACGMQRLTEDHSLVGELVKDGSITAQEAEHHPQKNILIRSLGQDGLVTVDEKEIDWQKGDYLLLCTDGLSNMIEEEELYNIVCMSKSFKEAGLNEEGLRKAVNTMVETARKRGGYDNISAVLVSND